MEALRSVIGGGKKKEDKPQQKKLQVKEDYEKITAISIPKFNMTRSGHVDYLVEVRKGGTSWQVKRRYTQFKKLHADLTSLCPMTTPYHCEYGVVPVLCGSSWTEVTNQSVELITKRKNFLEIYLEQLLVCRNRFYQARTALYSFLHDDELPLSSRPGTTPLPGLGASGGQIQESPPTHQQTQSQPIPQPQSQPTPQHSQQQSQPSLLAVSDAMTVPVPKGDDALQASCPSVPGPSFLNLLQPENGNSSPDDTPNVTPRYEGKQACSKCGKIEPIMDIEAWEKEGICDVCDETVRWEIQNEDEREEKDVLAVKRPQWANSTTCGLCNGKFSFFLRKHHCRKCGGIFCGYCSSYTHKLPELKYENEVRVCKTCKEVLINVVAVSSASTPSHQEESSDDATEAADDQSNFKADDFELITTLGKGTFGKVMKVRHRVTGVVYAMKVLSKTVVHKRRMVDYIREEKNILASVKHPFIVPLYDAFQTDHNLYLLLEFLPGGELYSHIYSQGRFGEVDARFYIAEMVLAVGYLHSHDIVHRDIKPENIVLDRNGHAKLTDFGLAKAGFSRAIRRSFVGSAEYLAPETVRGDPQTKAVDWWSVGVLLYEMLSGCAPYNGTNNNDVYNQIQYKELKYTHLKSDKSKGILKKLLMRDIRKRYTDAEEVMRDEFFESINWELLYQRKVKPPFVPDLEHNDTKYFSREFTHEWAVIEGERAGKGTIDMLSNKFDNFPGAATRRESPPPMAINIPKPPSLTEMVEGDCLQPGDSVMGGTDMSAAEAKSTFVGVWYLRSVELIAESGKISYPWGSDVVGQAVYSANGQFSLQCTMTRNARTTFKDDGYTKVTRDEMAEAYLSYVASFGVYTYEDGDKYITHHCIGSLVPNWAEAEQKRYFRFIDSNGSLDRDSLVLATGSLGIDGMSARTVMKFQRLSDSPALPGFMREKVAARRPDTVDT